MSRTLSSPQEAGPGAIDVLVEDEQWRAALGDDAEPACCQAAQAALKIASSGNCGAICIMLANDDFLQNLNRQYRNQDKPTNVLSFPGDGDASGEAEPVLGDIALSYETCLREARDQGKTLLDHARHLVVHGVLHLLGHDHEKESQAAAMEDLEIRALAFLGVKNPYV